jgi:hypothetical protein
MSLTLNSLTMSDVQVAIDALETDVAALQVEDALLATNVRSVAFIDMVGADYMCNATESAATAIVLTNAGTGSTILYITDSTNNPVDKKILISDGSGPIRCVLDIGGDSVPVFVKSNAIVYTGVGLYLQDNSVVVKQDSVAVVTAANTNEQIVKSCVAPAGTLATGDSFDIIFNALKSGTATTETIRLRAGVNGTTADTAIWTNAALATTNDACSFRIRVSVIDDTNIMVTTLDNSSTPWGVSTTIGGYVTVSSLAANPLIFSLTGQNSTGAETVSFYTFSSVYAKGTI